MPPTRAFWSFTLYDAEDGFFIPNEHKKYSVGENAGMKLNEDGGIEIHIAAEKPARPAPMTQMSYVSGCVLVMDEIRSIVPL